MIHLALLLFAASPRLPLEVRVAELERRQAQMDSLYLGMRGPGGGTIGGYRSEITPFGFYTVGWNATNHVIHDGTLVMADTTDSRVAPSIPIGKGFSEWDCKQIHRGQIMGILIGDCPAYSPGRIIFRGFVNRAVTEPGMRGNEALAPSWTTPGALGPARDRIAVGKAQRFSPWGRGVMAWVHFP